MMSYWGTDCHPDALGRSSLALASVPAVPLAKPKPLGERSPPSQVADHRLEVLDDRVLARASPELGGTRRTLAERLSDEADEKLLLHELEARSHEPAEGRQDRPKGCAHRGL